MEESRLCPGCGAPQRAGANFCKNCGKALPRLAGAPPQPPAPPQAVSPSPAPSRATPPPASALPPVMPPWQAAPGQAPPAQPPPAAAKPRLAQRPLFWASMIVGLSVCVCLVAVLAGFLWAGDGFDSVDLGDLFPATKTTAAGASPSKTTVPPTATKVPASATPTTAALDAPIVVEGAELQFVSAERQDSYFIDLVGETATAHSPDDELLIVEMTVISAGGADLGKMKVFVIDENGRRAMAGITVTRTDGDKKTISVTWIFQVSRAAETFVLEFPDGQVFTL